MAERNDQFAVGLGAGLSNLFTFVDHDFQEEIFQRAEKNSKFTKGLGIGLGKVFPFIGKESQSKLFILAQQKVEFAGKKVSILFGSCEYAVYFLCYIKSCIVVSKFCIRTARMVLS